LESDFVEQVYAKFVLPYKEIRITIYGNIRKGLDKVAHVVFLDLHDLLLIILHSCFLHRIWERTIRETEWEASYRDRSWSVVRIWHVVMEDGCNRNREIFLQAPKASLPGRLPEGPIHQMYAVSVNGKFPVCSSRGELID